MYPELEGLAEEAGFSGSERARNRELQLNPDKGTEHQAEMLRLYRAYKEWLRQNMGYGEPGQPGRWRYKGPLLPDTPYIPKVNPRRIGAPQELEM